MLGTFFDITSENVSTTLSYTKSLIADLSPFLTLIIAVGVGLIIFQVIVSTIRGQK